MESKTFEWFLNDVAERASGTPEEMTRMAANEFAAQQNKELVDSNRKLREALRRALTDHITGTWTEETYHTISQTLKDTQP
jgi:ClpP class serine protease